MVSKILIVVYDDCLLILNYYLLSLIIVFINVQLVYLYSALHYTVYLFYIVDVTSLFLCAFLSSYFHGNNHVHSTRV